MPGTIITNISNLVSAATQRVFDAGMIQGLGAAAYTAWMRQLPATYRVMQHAGINAQAAYASQVEGNDLPKNAIEEGNVKSYTQTLYSAGLSIGPMSAAYMAPELISRKFQEMGFLAGHLFDTSAYAVLSGGFADTGPDGVSLFNSAHPIPGGADQSNTGSSALSYTSLNAARAVCRRQKASNGQPAPFEPMFLVVPPDLEETAKQLVSSTVTGAGLQTNTFLGSLTVLVSPRLTDATDWFLLGAPAQNNYNMYVGKGPTPGVRLDPDSKSVVIDDIVWFDTGYDDYRGSFGASVAG